MRLDLYQTFTKKPSALRRRLRKLAPTWVSSPVRRIIQSIFFIAFLVLFFYVCWPYGASHYADTMATREKIPAESFLNLDPLVSLSTALAARAWVWSLMWAGAILLICVVFPRGFCGYLCPLGTLIDLFDWLIGKHVTRFTLRRDGWWVNLKYYILLGTLITSMLGILVSGFVAAIPVLTRGLLFTLGPAQMGTMKGWYLVPPINLGHVVSIVLFIVVLALGFFRPRFWCRYVCPTGALFSVGNVLRASERKVDDTCIDCDKCRQICPFDAIKTDYTTRTADCTLCQTCAGVCPTDSIHFIGRFEGVGLKAETAPPESEVALSRRGLIAATVGGVTLAMGVRHLFAGPAEPAVRPPGSVPEDEFLQLCIRCGECFKACPNNVLQPMGFENGLNGLWTPKVVANWSGCEPSCNNCGQVCPTGAIRALPLPEKRSVRMGLALINEGTCLPHAGKEACQMCVDECTSAGYNAIDFVRVGTQVDDDGQPIEDSGFLAPVVLADKCVGCGLCQTRCYNINVKQKHLLRESAIIVKAGPGREDRLTTGSYIDLREQERRKRQPPATAPAGGDGYLPDFLK